MSEVAQTLLERAWSVLNAPTGGELASFPLDIAFGGTACRVARDGNRIRHFLVPCIDESPPIDTRPAVLSASVRPLVFGGISATYLDVSCTDASLHPEFDDVIADVLEEIEHSSQPATDAGRVIARWRRLFRSRLVRGLSSQAKLGLFAELTVLSALLDVDPHFPVESWRGPLREPHDFETPARCIEVKAVGEDGDSIIVHGWKQLASDGGRPLDLAVVTVIVDPDGTTLAELVAELRQRVEAQGTLMSRLSAAAWDQQAASEDHDRYSVGPVFCIHVDDSVPRLIDDSLVAGRPPDGLSAMQYEVQLAAVIPVTYGSSLSSLATGGTG